MICRHRAYRLLTVSFFFARSLLVRVTIFCASSMVSTESLRPPNHPMPVHRCDAVFLVTFLIYACIDMRVLPRSALSVTGQPVGRSNRKIDQQTGLATRVVDVRAVQSSGGDCCDVVNRAPKYARDKMKMCETVS